MQFIVQLIQRCLFWANLQLLGFIDFSGFINDLYYKPRFGEIGEIGVIVDFINKSTIF